MKEMRTQPGCCPCDRGGKDPSPSSCAVLLEECRKCQHTLCCKILDVPLTKEEALCLVVDLEAQQRGENVLAKKADGTCAYLTDKGCRIWSFRPKACREYTCHGDTRIIEALGCLCRVT